VRIIPRVALLAALALAVVPLSAMASSAQEVPIPDDLSITVRKVVVGTGTGPSSVSVACEGAEAAALETVVLNFDAQGHPTTAEPPGFDIVDGAWNVSDSTGNGGSCTFTESATGGAASTSWTCDYTSTEVEVPESTQLVPAGCDADSGTGVGPITVVYPGDRVVSQQASTVVFTNTFVAAPPVQAAPQVVAQPTFTG
jgi:hypothetical protein